MLLRGKHGESWGRREQWPAGCARCLLIWTKRKQVRAICSTVPVTGATPGSRCRVGRPRSAWSPLPRQLAGSRDPRGCLLRAATRVGDPRPAAPTPWPGAAAPRARGQIPASPAAARRGERRSRSGRLAAGGRGSTVADGGGQQAEDGTTVEQRRRGQQDARVRDASRLVGFAV